jgi:hypothetical protein
VAPAAPGLAELLDRAARDEVVDVEGFVRALEQGERRRLAARIGEIKGALPAPIGPQVEGPDARRHRTLGRLQAWTDAFDGHPEELLAIARREWLKGGSHARYLRLLLEFGRAAQAVSTARALLAHEDCSDRAELEALIAQAARPPGGWDEAVAAFARDPSIDGWDRLLRFTPDDVYDQRVRYTLRLLRELEVDPDTLFRCATHVGVTPEAIELVDRGEVSPALVLERAGRSSAETRPLWLGLAARAACVRGDRFTTVRLLREAVAAAGSADVLTLDVRFVRDHGDDELQHLLDRAGLPRA